VVFIGSLRAFPRSRWPPEIGTQGHSSSGKLCEISFASALGDQNDTRTPLARHSEDGGREAIRARPAVFDPA
jgi:hypothetical protein